MPIPPRFAHAHACQHMEDISFWLEFAQNGAGEILELGCGTGRVLALVAANAPQCLTLGLDNDPELLNFLHKHHPIIPLLQADMRTFHLGAAFDRILLPCNTLSMFAQADRRAILDCVRQHLSAQGIFAASLPNPYRWSSLPASGEIEVEETFSLQDTGEDIQVSSEWHKDRAWLNVDWHYDLMLPDGQVRRYTFSTRHSLAVLDALRSDFVSAGLRIRREYGDFDHSPYTPYSPYWIVEATR